MLPDTLFVTFLVSILLECITYEDVVNNVITNMKSNLNCVYDFAFTVR